MVLPYGGRVGQRRILKEFQVIETPFFVILSDKSVLLIQYDRIMYDSVPLSPQSKPLLAERFGFPQFILLFLAGNLFRSFDYLI